MSVHDEALDILSRLMKTVKERNELLEENNKLRKVLSDARRWVGSEPMGANGCRIVEQIHRDIDEALNEL